MIVVGVDVEGEVDGLEVVAALFAGGAAMGNGEAVVQHHSQDYHDGQHAHEFHEGESGSRDGVGCAS
jgi:hypothetical protein